MALSMSLTGIGKRSSSDDRWFIDNVNWRPHNLIHDSRFRRVDLVCGYLDYVAVLTMEEALALCFIARLRGWKDRSAKDDEVHDLLLSHQLTTQFVLARIYEWESD